MKWRIAQFHSEDRYEPEDEGCDQIRSRLRAIESSISSFTPEDRFPSLNQLFLQRRKLQLQLAERLYGK